MKTEVIRARELGVLEVVGRGRRGDKSGWLDGSKSLLVQHGLLLPASQIHIWDLVADLVKIEEGGLQCRVRTPGSLEGLLDKSPERKTLLLLKILW